MYVGMARFGKRAAHQRDLLDHCRQDSLWRGIGTDEAFSRLGRPLSWYRIPWWIL